jgi:hypothetical protein
MSAGRLRYLRLILSAGCRRSLLHGSPRRIARAKAPASWQIEAKWRGDTERKIAAEKEVSSSTVTKLWALFRETGSHEPRPNPEGRKPALYAEQQEEIARKIDEQ